MKKNLILSLLLLLAVVSCHVESDRQEVDIKFVRFIDLNSSEELDSVYVQVLDYVEGTYVPAKTSVTEFDEIRGYVVKGLVQVDDLVLDPPQGGGTWWTFGSFEGLFEAGYQCNVKVDSPERQPFIYTFTHPAAIFSYREVPDTLVKGDTLTFFMDELVSMTVTITNESGIAYFEDNRPVHEGNGGGISYVIPENLTENSFRLAVHLYDRNAARYSHEDGSSSTSYNLYLSKQIILGDDGIQ